MSWPGRTRGTDHGPAGELSVEGEGKAQPNEENKMPGIIVGIDGSDHSRRALEWAIKEAAIRNAPLTVLTVSQAVVGYSGVPVSYPGDQDRATHAREAAQEETDSVLKQLDDGTRPSSVPVHGLVGPAAH